MLVGGQDRGGRGGHLQKRAAIDHLTMITEAMVGGVVGFLFYSLPLRMAAITRGLRRPCMTAITHSGRLSGA